MGEVYDGETIEFRWGKKRGLGGKKKDVRFYESFNYDNVEYALYDCVYLYKEGELEPFIGKLIKIWENSDKTKRVKVLWFFRPCEILNYLGAEVPLDNELFLASGEGVGLANINPLEAIAGKCNVVCISKDKRNPPPSDEQVQLADFVFYRTFDVGLCEISDKIKENIAGIEVRFILNRQNLWKSEGVAIVSDKKNVSGNAIPRAGGVEIDSKENKVSGNAIPRTDGVEIDSDKNKVSGNAVPRAETVVLSRDKSEEHRNLKTQGSLMKGASEECRPLETKDPLTKEKCTRGDNRGSSVYVESSEIDETINLQPRILSENTSSKSKTKENEDLNFLLGTQKSFLKKAASAGVQSEDVIKTNDGLGNSSGERTNTGLNINENIEHKASSIKQKSSVGENPSSNVGVKVAEKDYDIREKINDEATSSFKNQRKVCKAIVDEVDDDNKVKPTTNSDILECRPSKRPKLDSPIKVFEENSKNHVQKLGHGPNVKASTKIALTSGEKSKPTLSKSEDRFSNKPKVEEKLPLQSDGRLPKATSPRQPLGEENPMDPQGVVVPQMTKIDNGPFKKPKFDEKRDEKLPKASSKQHLDGENTDDHQAVEVNQRPNADRRKWFSELSWEERMEAAYKQGTLVLLENLAPAYTSAEVENIVWHGFKTSCTAKMIQRTAYSSRFSGQALVAFKTKEAAQTVVTKLDEGCLLLSNERPLVGRFVSPPLPGKQSTFFGHLVIEKLRGQMQREMKEAVSTSHCSQPNTLEYDMAKEWCLLQERWDCTWKKLHQQQGKELEELKSNLKLRL